MVSVWRSSRGNNQLASVSLRCSMYIADAIIIHIGGPLLIQQSLYVYSLVTRPLPPQRLVFSGLTRGGRVWEIAYDILDPSINILAHQSDCSKHFDVIGLT